MVVAGNVLASLTKTSSCGRPVFHLLIMGIHDIPIASLATANLGRRGGTLESEGSRRGGRGFTFAFVLLSLGWEQDWGSLGLASSFDILRYRDEHCNTGDGD